MKVALRPNEYIRDKVDFHPLVFLGPNLLFIIGMAVLLLAINRMDIFFKIPMVHFFPHNKVVISVFVIALILMLPLVIRHLDNHLKTYMVTNQRVCFRRGIIAVTERNVPLAKINDVQLKQSFVQRLFNAGDIVIQTGNDEHVSIKDITHPVEFRNQILFSIRQDVSFIDQNQKIR